MIPITYLGNPAYLLNDAPNWDGIITLEAELPVAIENGLDAHETRRALGDTARLTITYNVTLLAGSLPTFRNALQALNDLPVLCPLWMAWFDAGTSPAVTTAFYVLMDDSAAPAIQPASAQPFARPAYPLLVGRLAKVPEPKLISDVEALAEISFTENDQSAVSFPAFAAPLTFAAANGARPVLPWVPDWSVMPMSAKAAVDIERQNIGHGRVTANAMYPQPPRRDVEQSFVLSAADSWNFLSFWLGVGATAGNFWIPTGVTEAFLTANILAGDMALHVDKPAARGGNAYVLLDDLNKRAALQITGTAGSAWNLAAAPGAAFTAADTRIEALMLGRFQESKISMAWEDTGQAIITTKFTETPLEAVGASSETVGSTMGPMPTNAYLYVFAVNYPGANQTWRYTSFERDVTNGGHTFTAALLEHGDIQETAVLDRQTVEIKSRNFAGNPLAMLVPFQLEWPLLLSIYEVDVPTAGGTAATNPRCYFVGEVTKCDTEGPYLNATAGSLTSLFERKIPRRIYNPGCNWILFESKCGVAKANWKWQGIVSGWDAPSSGLSLASVVSVASPVNTIALTAHLFAGGYLTVGSGSAVQYRMIAESTAAIAGALTLSVSTGFFNAPNIGDVVTFYPGCDGQKATCEGTFANYLNHGGYPWIPAANPTTAQIYSNNYGQKK